MLVTASATLEQILTKCLGNPIDILTTQMKNAAEDTTIDPRILSTWTQVMLLAYPKNRWKIVRADERHPFLCVDTSEGGDHNFDLDELVNPGNPTTGARILHQVIPLLAEIGVDPGDPDPATILEGLIQAGAKVDTDAIMLAAKANLQGCVSALAKQMGL